MSGLRNIWTFDRGKEKKMGRRPFIIGQERIKGRFRTGLLLAILHFFFYSPDASAQFSEAGVAKFKIPAEAPDFALKEVDGGTVSLKEFRGRPIVLNFFSAG